MHDSKISARIPTANLTELLTVVVNCAIVDIDLYCGRNRYHRETTTEMHRRQLLKNALQALHWFYDGYPEVDRISYGWICRHLGADVEVARESLLKQWHDSPRFQNLLRRYHEWRAYTTEFLTPIKPVTAPQPAPVDAPIHASTRIVRGPIDGVISVKKASVEQTPVGAVARSILEWEAKHNANLMLVFSRLPWVSRAFPNSIDAAIHCLAHCLVAGHALDDISALLKMSPKRMLRYAHQCRNLKLSKNTPKGTRRKVWHYRASWRLPAALQKPADQCRSHAASK